VAAIDQPHALRSASASRAASRTAERAGVEVRAAHGASEIRAVSELLARVWGTATDASPGPRNVLSAIADTDGYVAGAWLDGELVGASFGVTYLDVDGPALRSQVTGTVRPRHGIGEALKRHQRAWAAERGMRRITWTFDPLVRSNAHFNLDRLGARIVRFVPDFYGSLDDGLNGADETDRCVVSWEVAVDDRPVPEVSSADLLADGSHHGLLGVAADGAPVLADGVQPGVLVATPDDIVALRQTQPQMAVAWRRAVRHALSAAFGAGLEADLITTDGAYRFVMNRGGG
jgi:predicted GNAT superfamily acetyltransferase